jgi:hypothetical protein
MCHTAAVRGRYDTLWSLGDDDVSNLVGLAEV